MPISIFDLPLITTLRKYHQKIDEVYRMISKSTLNITNPNAAIKLQNSIKSNREIGSVFLRSRSETYTINLIVSNLEILNYAKKFSLNRKDQVVFRFSDEGTLAINERILGKTVFVISLDDAGFENKATVDSIAKFKEWYFRFCDLFLYCREDWINVSLGGILPPDKRSDADVSLAYYCFDPKCYAPSLFSTSSPDGNLKSFCARYLTSVNILSSTYYLVTAHLILPATKTEFENKYGTVLDYNNLREEKGAIKFIIHSDYLSYLLAEPSGEVLNFKNVHSLVYAKATEIFEEKYRRKFTAWILKELPFTIGHFEPTLNDYTLPTKHFEYVSRGVRTVGLVANKATGKSSLIKSIKGKHYYIDSDLYGMMLTYITLGGQERRDLFTSKNVQKIVDSLVGSMTINDKGELTFIDNYESLFETVAREYIRKKKISLSCIAGKRAAKYTPILQFLDVYNAATKIFPLGEYLHTITEVIPRLTTVLPSSRFVLFAHTSYELYGILGGAVFQCQFCTDENLSILLRDRDSDYITQVFLQRFYESIEMSTFNAIPSALIAEYLSTD